MALIELAKVIASDPAASRRWAAEPLPPGDRLLAVITARLTALPEPTRAALLVAAVADGPDLRAPRRWRPRPRRPWRRPSGWAWSRWTGPACGFRHPLVRSAIYHGAPFAQRAAAHRQLAAALPDQPDRQAWHLAAATLQPDEELASRLETTADQARRRGGVTAAAAAMERAAELSPDPSDQARRLVSAAATAVSTGQAAWVADLATRALAVTADPELRLLARSSAGWALAYSGRRSAALPALISVAEEAAPDFPALAWEALADAATVAYQSGAATGRAAVDRLLTRMGPSGDAVPSGDRRGPSGDAGPQQAWIRACTDPFGNRAELVAYLGQAAGSPLGGIGEVADRFRGLAAGRIRPGAAVAAGRHVPAAGARHAGHQRRRPDRARLAVRRHRTLGSGARSRGGGRGLGRGQPDGHRGRDRGRARGHCPGPAGGRAGRPHPRGPGAGRGRPGGKRADRGAGLAGARGRGPGRGRPSAGVHPAPPVFSEEGVPVHNIFSYLGVADLATAAVRADRRREGRIILERALGHPGERALGHRAGRFRPGWSSSSPGPAASWPTRPAPEPTSPGRSATPPVSSGRSSGPSFASTTPNGCGGAAGSTKPSRNWSTRWKPSGGWGPGRWSSGLKRSSERAGSSSPARPGWPTRSWS